MCPATTTNQLLLLLLLTEQQTLDVPSTCYCSESNFRRIARHLQEFGYELAPDVPGTCGRTANVVQSPHLTEASTGTDERNQKFTTTEGRAVMSWQHCAPGLASPVLHHPDCAR
uniref:(northern house mosquito) hypothetical protein n=1 Tax=Culex pipiens TaxID=7175 RepID=A0A8D8K0I0_CULPI